MKQRTTHHPQPWCEMCQSPDRACDGDHTAKPISTPLSGFGWAATDDGAEIPTISVYATWEEGFGADSAVPQVYIGAVAPKIVRGPQVIQGYLDIEMAVRLRDSITMAIDAVTATLSADHHLICDCGEVSP